MPLVNNKFLEPQEAFKKGFCPECGHELADVDPETHLHEHWPDFDRPAFASEEAKRRGQMIRDFGRQQAKDAQAAKANTEDEAKPAAPEEEKQAKIDQLEKELERIKAQP